MNIRDNEFVPVKKEHTNKLYDGVDCKQLPVTEHYAGNVKTLNSVWRLNSVLQRLIFLFSGELTLGVMSRQQPPAACCSSAW